MLRVTIQRIFLSLLFTAAICPAQYPELTYRSATERQAREYLFGNWNGLRTDLEKRGIVFDFESANDNMWVLHGGASNQGTAWERIRGTFDVDFGKLSGIAGLKFHATALWQTGDNVGANLNSYANPSSIDSVHVFRMDSYWIQDTFAQDKVTVRLGQMAGWDFYGTQEYGADFMIEPLGYAFGNMFNNVYLTYNPAGVPAAQVLLDTAKKTDTGRRGLYAEAGLFSGNRNPYVQDPTGLEFKIKNSPVVAAELGYLIDATTSAEQRLPRRRKLYPGIYRFGSAYNPGSFTNQLTGQTSKGNYLIYLLAAQAVYRAEKGTDRGLDLTLGFDTSPNDVNQQYSMATAGVVYHGLLPSRRLDDLAFGFVSTGSGSAYSQVSVLTNGYPLGWEKAYTLDYRATLRPWLVIQPTAQYFSSIAGDPHRTSGVVIGFRTYLRF
jgi:carbohydrate-selective porin OprB